MASYERIGNVKGRDVFWKRETGEVFVRRGSWMPMDTKLSQRAYTIATAFALADDYLGRGRP